MEEIMSSQESSRVLGFGKDTGNNSQPNDPLKTIVRRGFEIFPDPVQVNQDPQDHLTAAEHLSLARNIQT
jgi:hypothetical protein